MDIADGPEAVLGLVDERFRALLGEAGRTRRGRARHRHRRARPGRVRAPGEPVNPPIMPGWDGFSIPRLVRRRATTRRCSSTTTSTSWPSASTGRTGARSSTCCSSRSAPASAAASSPAAASTAAPQGAAGDIGHIRSRRPRRVICRCGNIGCLEAVAGGARAGRERLAEAGSRPSDSRDVVAARARGRRRRDPAWCARPAATSARCSPRCVNFFNPRRDRRSAATSPRPTSSCWPASARSSSGARCRWPPRDLRIVARQLGRPGGRDGRGDHGDRARAGSRGGGPGAAGCGLRLRPWGCGSAVVTAARVGRNGLAG